MFRSFKIVKGERELTSGVVTQVHSLVEAVTKQTLLRLDERGCLA